MTHSRQLGTAAVVCALLWPFTTTARLQQSTAPIRIAATSIDELQAFGPLVDAMVRSGELVSRARFADRVVPESGHEGLGQSYNGVPVWGGDLVVSTERGVVTSITGTVHAGIAIDTVPALTEDEARTILERVGGATLAQDGPVLTVLPTPTGDHELTYRATLSNLWTYFIDADDGSVVWRLAEIERQSSQCRPGASACEVGTGRGSLGEVKKLGVTPGGGVFLARDSMRPADLVTLDLRGNATRATALTGLDGLRPGFAVGDIASDSDNAWTDAAVVDAHSHMGWVYDYLFDRHGYDGLDGRNGRQFAMVNPPTFLTPQIPTGGAFWLATPFGPDGTGAMLFGRSPTGHPVTSLDAVAHELVHGVTNHRSLGELQEVPLGGISTLPCPFVPGVRFVCSQGRAFVGLNQVGAVSEAFADVLATGAEFHVGSATTADYLIGEGIGGFGPIRSLADPASIGPCVDGHVNARANPPVVLAQCPDHASLAASFYIVETPRGGFGYWPDTRRTDDGGEHGNSTIVSHAFYLAVEGGRNRTSGLLVEGVGAASRHQIEQAFFDALVTRLPRSPSLVQAARSVVAASASRFGANGDPTRALTQAFRAVGLLE